MVKEKTPVYKNKIVNFLESKPIKWAIMILVIVISLGFGIYHAGFFNSENSNNDGTPAVSNAQSEQNQVAGGGTKISECRYPVNKIKVVVSPARCQQLRDDCTKFRITATSAQIRLLIASGHTPCQSYLRDPDECEAYDLGTGWSLLFCLGSSELCLNGMTGNAEDYFMVAAGDPSIKITDAVSWCPTTEDGVSLGACASSLVDQCNPDATITVFVN